MQASSSIAGKQVNEANKANIRRNNYCQGDFGETLQMWFCIGGRECVRACVRACPRVRACVLAFVCACVRAYARAYAFMCWCVDACLVRVLVQICIFLFL